MTDDSKCLLCDAAPVDFGPYLCSACALQLGISDRRALELFQKFLFGMFQASCYANKEKPTLPKPSDSETNWTLVFSPTSGLPNAAKFLFQYRMLGLVKELDGDVVECGVGGGQSLLGWIAAIWDEARGRKIWGFDSFVGFPGFTKEDRPTSPCLPGDWSIPGGINPVDFISGMLAASGVPGEWSRANVSIVQGWFDESVPLYMGKKIALLSLDADLYQSYKVCLEHLAPLVIPGGIIVFDEYMGTMEYKRYPGAKKAIDEFLSQWGSQYGEMQRDRYGKYYIEKLDVL